MTFLLIILSPFALLWLCAALVRTRPATDKMPTTMDTPSRQIEKLVALSDPAELRSVVSRDGEGHLVAKTVGVDPSSGTTFILTKRY